MAISTSSLVPVSNSPEKKNNWVGSICKIAISLGLVFYLFSLIISNESIYPKNCPSSDFLPVIKNRVEHPESISSDERAEAPAQAPAPAPTPAVKREDDFLNDPSPTNLSHLVFGLVGSENAWHHRKAYIESWWRPNVTRGYLFLDTPPTEDLLPWSKSSPPYKISDDLTNLLDKEDITPQRILHGILETFREDHSNMRWLVMGDDDSIFFLENMVEELAKYDHRKYYYLGGHSEFVLSNYWFSFKQGFGGAGFMLSYPLAKALAKDLENCMLRYSHLNAADKTAMACIADIGVNLSPHQGIHQIDLTGDISGFLSAHPLSPLISLHHFDMEDPIFPSMDRFDSTRHLMKAAKVDQSRMLQQTICHHRHKSWSFSVAWGYSAHIYEKIMPRSYLQDPIETFKKWNRSPRPPHYMFDTRRRSNDPCEAPHVFFFESIKRMKSGEILTTYSRAWPRGLPACALSGNHTADFISRIQVISPPTKRMEFDRCECCDIIGVDKVKAHIRYRNCLPDEIVAK